MSEIHKATEENRRLVGILGAGGVRQELIAEALGIAERTLRKHYRQELDMGAAKANAAVIQTAFQMATDGKNVAMTIFWLKTRCGWREATPMEPYRDESVERLSDAELESMIRRSNDRPKKSSVVPIRSDPSLPA